MKKLSYSDVALIPRKCVLNSRSQADTSISFANRVWKLPVIPANMSTTISFELAEKLEEENYFYILHRFYDYYKILEWIRQMNDKNKYVSISIGISSNDIKLIHNISDFGLEVDCITIDVAHGHNVNVSVMINKIKELCPNTFVIAGNVSTIDGVNFLHDAGADAVKIFIAPGLACTTYNKTGFGSIGTFSTIREICESAKIPVIADGGVRNHGDIPKALVAGASMVMIGSMFAECSDSPAETIYEYQTKKEHNHVYSSGLYSTVAVPSKKRYFGSASQFQKGENKHVEGREVIIPYNPQTYMEKLNEIRQDLQSAISYAGGRDLNAFLYVYYTQIN